MESCTALAGGMLLLAAVMVSLSAGAFVGAEIRHRQIKRIAARSTQAMDDFWDDLGSQLELTKPAAPPSSSSSGGAG